MNRNYGLRAHPHQSLPLVPHSPSWRHRTTKLVLELSSPLLCLAELAQQSHPLLEYSTHSPSVRSLQWGKVQDLITRANMMRLSGVHTCFPKVQFCPLQILLHSTLTKPTADSSLLPWGRSGPVTLRKDRSAYICKARLQYQYNSNHDPLLLLLLLQISKISFMEPKNSHHQISGAYKNYIPKCDEQELTSQITSEPFSIAQPIWWPSHSTASREVDLGRSIMYMSVHELSPSTVWADAKASGKLEPTDYRHLWANPKEHVQR